MALKFRRGSTAQQSGSLAFGEPYVNTTLGTLVIGGATGDIVLSAGGTGSTGNFGAISGSGLDITGNANIAGNLTLGGAITIGDATADTVNVVASLSSSLIPQTTNAFDLGSATKIWRDLYISTGSIKFVEGTSVVKTLNAATLTALETATGSSNVSITNLNTTTASLNTSVSNLNTFSGSENTKSTTLQTYTASIDTRLTEIGVVSGSLITSASAAKTTNDSQGVSITNLNTTTASLNTSVTNLNTTTASLNTSVTNLNTYTSSLKTALSLSGADLTVLGNLTVQGDTTTLNTANLLVEDKLIELAIGTTTSAGANGAGIYISGANASILWDDANSTLDINKSIDIVGNITLTGNVDGVDVSVLNSNINTTTASLNTSVSNLNTFSGSENTKSTTLATLTGSYDTRFTTIGSYTSSLETRMTAVGTSTGSLNTSVTNLNLTTASLNTSVSNLNTATSSYETKGRGIVSGSAQIDGSLLGSNKTITVGSTSITLGGTATTIAGLTSVSSTGFTGALTGNASTATTLATARTINGTSFDGSANITIPNLVSGSSQITYASISSIPAGIVSGSSQTIINLNSAAPGVVSGSSQITLSSTTGYGSILNQAVLTSSSPTFAGLTINGAITATGDITAYYSSDRRYKNNIQIIPNALEKVSKLNGVTWEWNDDVNEVTKQAPNTGLIAQEVLEVLPEVVKQKEDGFLGLDYAKMIGLLVEAIKEQQSQIEELKAQIGSK